WRRVRQQLGRDHAARARDVLHDERPPEDLGKPCCQHAAEDVRIPAGRGGRDDTHRLDGVFLRLREACAQGKQGGKEAHRNPLVSTKRGAFTLASNSLAMVPRLSRVTSGVIWKGLRIMYTIRCA